MFLRLTVNGHDVGVGVGIGVQLGIGVGVEFGVCVGLGVGVCGGGPGCELIVGAGVGECGGGPGWKLADGFGAGLLCEPCPPNEQRRKFPMRVCVTHKATIPASTGQYLAKNVFFLGVGVAAGVDWGDASGTGDAVGGSSDGCASGEYAGVGKGLRARRVCAFSIERTTETLPQAFGM